DRRPFVLPGDLPRQPGARVARPDERAARRLLLLSSGYRGRRSFLGGAEGRKLPCDEGRPTPALDPAAPRPAPLRSGMVLPRLAGENRHRERGDLCDRAREEG